jgi:uncharacterized membrane protein
MNKNRVEAFSDGVLAIIVTIMVLELRAPESSDWKALLHLYPKFLSYTLSFLMVWIYWNNHHHLFHSVHKINGKVLLANGLLLFVLSFLPFATAWMGETHFSGNPIILMGVILFLCAAAFNVLTKQLIDTNGGEESTLAKAIGKDIKGNISLACYSLGILSAFFMPTISFIIYALVAFMWLVPDKRLEKII